MAAAGLIQAIIQGVAGTGMAVSGLANKAKAKRMAKNNIRPTYETPQSEYDNLALTKSRASQGLSDSSLTAFGRANDRALTGSLDSILKNGGDNNQVSTVSDAYTSGAAKLALADDQARMQNINALIAQQGRMSDYADKQWMINKYAPYADRAAAAADLAKQGETKLWNGISMIAGAGSNYFGNRQQQADTKDLMKFSHDLKMQENSTDTRQNVTSDIPPGQTPQENNIDPNADPNYKYRWGNGGGGGNTPPANLDVQDSPILTADNNSIKVGGEGSSLMDNLANNVDWTGYSSAARNKAQYLLYS